MTAPSADYLRGLVNRLIGDESTSRAFRNDCHQLLLAINSNDVMEITSSLERLRARAAATGVRLPDVEITER